MSYARIRAIAHHLPDLPLDNGALSAQFPDWPVEQISAKTGIEVRRVAAADETSGDLAVLAACKLFEKTGLSGSDFDFILLCTQSPDYFLPTTACLLQERLGLPVTAGALDFNLGCSGFVYGLGLAKGLLETGQAQNLLLITAETYSKFLHPADRSVRTIFGDAAAAVWISADSERERLGPFVWGTDGAGAQNLIVKSGAMRHRVADLDPASVVPDENGAIRSDSHLYMNGPEIFNFTLKAVPAAVERLSTLSGIATESVDLFVFHQANAFMLSHLRRKLKLPEDRFVVCLKHCGNTVSSTIPIALEETMLSGRLHEGMTVMLVGFGVGLSWGATLVRF
jgi:3-oxoacyl-[acyl-carrier-protein] synthase-3